MDLIQRPGQPDPEADEAYHSDEEAANEMLDTVLHHITLTGNETHTVRPPACKLEMFSFVLVDIGLMQDKLTLSTEQRNKVLQLWNTVEDHDKQPEHFNQLYRTHCGNTFYCPTKRDDLVDAAVVQRLKMAKCYAPAQQDISAQHNRLTLVELLWLPSPQSSRSSPERCPILKSYERIQHQILVEDPVLSKARFL
ncbi:Hypothetical protein SMAX5B_021342 [Scophthalmus maximus]|uniref:Uncharacterized protein n=1 Tax=Scophthalmus maximus TaxID=52904 RepID=A0A2U9BMS0_SCOMX|nr:Hypothetical protein SMAX5B_021342 [Scophthalmus maximus]KAF0047702.1 hypothetical protein F2P81_001335 [Scophthalmus maximus]